MSKINKIGIMSGRLSEPLTKKIQEFPRNTWKYEFEKALIKLNIFQSRLVLQSIHFWLTILWKKNFLVYQNLIYKKT